MFVWLVIDVNNWLNFPTKTGLDYLVQDIQAGGKKLSDNQLTRK